MKKIIISAIILLLFIGIMLGCIAFPTLGLISFSIVIGFALFGIIYSIVSEFID